MSISFESIVFLHRKMLKSSPFNNHFTQHFSPEPDAHCSGRCPLQIALQRSLTLLSKRKPQLSTWVLLKTLVPRCVFTPKYGALECSYLIEWYHQYSPIPKCTQVITPLSCCRMLQGLSGHVAKMGPKKSRSSR